MTWKKSKGVLESKILIEVLKSQALQRSIWISIIKTIRVFMIPIRPSRESIKALAKGNMMKISCRCG